MNGEGGGGIGAIPWLGFGWQALNWIGESLGPSFWEGRARLATTYGDRMRRIQCLAAAGYDLPAIRDTIRQETGGADISIEPGSTADRVYQNVHESIESGQRTQQGWLEGCAHMVGLYNKPYVSPGEVESGRRITGPSDRPAPTVMGPPVTAPPAMLPGTTGAPPPRQPPQTPGQRQLSLIRALLIIWQNIMRWRRQRQGPPVYRINLPSWPAWPRPTPVTAPPTQYPPYGGFEHMYVNTSLLGGGENGFGGGWPGLLGQALQTAAAIWGPNQAQPGGAPILTAGFMPSLGIPGMDIVGQGMGPACTQLQSPFAAGGGRGARAKIHVLADPITGRPVWFRPAGRPLLWSSDLTACKRVRKIAARARRAKGR